MELEALDGNWLPDLTLRYAPTFSQRDLIFGIDGGILYNGEPSPASVERPKFGNIEVRDQVLGGRDGVPPKKGRGPKNSKCAHSWVNPEVNNPENRAKSGRKC